MSVTRASLESVLISRVGAWMGKASMPVTTDGANVALTDPLWHALVMISRTPAVPLQVTDADLVGADDDLDELLDRAELRLLKNIQRNWIKIDQRVDVISQNWNDVAEAIAKAIESQETHVRRVYGSVASLEAGVWPGTFQEGAE